MNKKLRLQKQQRHRQFCVFDKAQHTACMGQGICLCYCF